MDFKKFSKLIMIEQTLFALPFAYLGLLFAGGGAWRTWVWVTLALISARTAGMSFNRVIDADIDAKNPRTKDRLIPRGEVKKNTVWFIAFTASSVLVLASFMLNQLCFYLSFPAVILLFSYSFFKRFSSSSHFYLGFVEAAAPIGGYFAVTGLFTFFPFLLGLSIMTWIAGLDIVYALQDKTFDEKEGLHSLPVRLGIKKALVISSVSYILSISVLIFSGVLAGMGAPYWASVILVGMIFAYQQILARGQNAAVSMKKFFKINMLVSPLLFFGAFIDVYIL